MPRGTCATLVEPLPRADGHQVEPVVRYDPVSVWGGLYRYLDDHPAALVAINTRSRAGCAGWCSGAWRRHRPAQSVAGARRAADPTGPPS